MTGAFRFCPKVNLEVETGVMPLFLRRELPMFFYEHPIHWLWPLLDEVSLCPSFLPFASIVAHIFGYLHVPLESRRCIILPTTGTVSCGCILPLWCVGRLFRFWKPTTTQPSLKLTSPLTSRLNRGLLRFLPTAQNLRWSRCFCHISGPYPVGHSSILFLDTHCRVVCHFSCHLKNIYS